MFFGNLMIASRTYTQLDLCAYYTHSPLSGHYGLTGAARQSSVTLNTTLVGFRTNRDSWCLNYQGLFSLLFSFFSGCDISLCFLRWRGARDAHLRGRVEGEEGSCTHCGLFCLSTRALAVSAFISRNNRPIHNHLRGFLLKAADLLAKNAPAALFCPVWYSGAISRTFVIIKTHKSASTLGLLRIHKPELIKCCVNKTKPLIHVWASKDKSQRRFLAFFFYSVQT